MTHWTWWITENNNIYFLVIFLGKKQEMYISTKGHVSYQSTCNSSAHIKTQKRTNEFKVRVLDAYEVWLYFTTFYATQVQLV